MLCNCPSIQSRDLTPADSDTEFLTIAKDLPRYGKHLFVAKVTIFKLFFCSALTGCASGWDLVVVVGLG